MLTVARYFESICNKTNFLFSLLAKKIQPTFIFDNGSTYKMNDGPNEKNVFVLEKSNKENYCCKEK